MFYKISLGIKTHAIPDGQNNYVSEIHNNIV